ncbi:FAD:protein FMN transferase [Desulfosudis oleivorans]|uniref:FAD:protein FMN transferase n=1 Tax=Desulfosudis oleivorans (strain DSM 6200 / JCM 39069 / Hxd3) TaxID=96561 RepID=A9A0T7_DESOH|nr:FAD:protein FMN transferase [Desulfosudis oleivorans]ABW67562.1 ApbE family lipoprotein [Desulfosudis oleivorans Hxd3]
MHALVREKHMACAWQMKCFPQPDRDLAAAEALMKKAFEVVTAIETKLTEFAASPFNRINDQAGITPVAVDEEIWGIVQRAITFGRRTNGVFNIAFATVMRSKTPDDPALKKLADFRNIELDEAARTIFLPDRRMRISLGGIGKGYAVDQAFGFLRKNGLVNFMVNGSGDLRVHSLPNAPRPWRMGIQNPFDPQKQIGMVMMRQNALASSGNYLKKGHILSDRQEVMAATVQGETCEFCDMWGTFLMCLPLDEALNELDREKLFGILVDKNARVHLSKAAKADRRDTTDGAGALPSAAAS